MNRDIVAELLGKLSKRTGRQWTMDDLIKLAEKVPKNGAGNIDSVLNELGGMGLNLSDETKKKVKQQVKDGKPISPDQVNNLMIHPVKEKGEQKKGPTKASGNRASDKGKTPKSISLRERIKKMQSNKRRPLI
ncbi:hypothetical protein NDK47_03620 [Brevibacillus ruminantium]|uniref:Uncharacterized protein n=1 Tax=Brevibacillus ruminantium TaxID=2950604 RepID=A0ABY4WHX5_9BACL|nr:hypothetical protein [Brevibacillus ruminantium]USG66406.1 hypothetical protein NDK47_03620 [Brevibacillus ruminantium]